MRYVIWKTTHLAEVLLPKSKLRDNVRLDLRCVLDRYVCSVHALDRVLSYAQY